MECEICGGEVGLLGTLGKIAHLQCRNCGMHSHMDKQDFNELVGEEDEEE